MKPGQPPKPGQTVKVTLTGRVVQSVAGPLYLRLVLLNGSYISFDYAGLTDVEVTEDVA